MNEDQTLQEIEDAKIKAQIEEISSAKIAEYQANIAKAVGNNDNDKYDSMGDLRSDIDRRAEDKARQYSKEAVDNYKKEVEAKEDKIKADEQAKIKQTAEEQNQEWNKMTAEWKEAVADGIAPSISEDLNKKLESGVTYKDLSEAERNDPGLVFYNKARQAHVENRRSGSATSFYRTIAKFDDKPSSSKAPIFGGSVANPSYSDEFTDSDLNEATNRVMNMGLPTK